MHIHNLRWLALLFLMAAVTPAIARVLHVKPDGADGKDGTSWATAKATIQAASNAASPGDEVWVAAGTYHERVTLLGGRALYGGFAGTETSRSQRDWVGNVTILDGGRQGCTVTTAYGGGESSAIVDGVTVTGGNGCGIRTGCPTVIEHCRIAGNTGHGVEQWERVWVRNCVIASNTRDGVHTSEYNDWFITNCTIVGNATGACLERDYYYRWYPVHFANNIVYGNADYGLCGWIDIICDNQINNNCVFGNGTDIDKSGNGWRLANTLKQDPRLVDTAAGDYRLRGDSPCRDSGDRAFVVSGATDYAGEARITGATVDIGAHELGPPSRPDLAARVRGTSAWVGSQYIAPAQPQTVSTLAYVPTPTVVDVRIENAGSATDSIRLQGPGSSDGWTIRYFGSRDGDDEITAAVTGAGWICADLPSCSSREVRVEAAPTQVGLTKFTRTIKLTIVSTGDATVGDALDLTATVPARYQPDIAVRPASGSAWVGDHAAVARPEMCSSPAQVDVGSPATYLVRVRNDGAFADRMVITGTGGSAAWHVRYQLDGASADLTTAVTDAGGWRTPLLPPGQACTLLVTITPVATSSDTWTYPVAVTARSVASPTRCDTAQLAPMPGEVVHWTTDQVLGPKGALPYAGVYEFDNLVIDDGVQLFSSGVSHLVLRVRGALILGKGATIRVRNGYFTDAPTLPIGLFTPEVLGTAGDDLGGGLRAYPGAFGRGGNGGNGGSAYPVSKSFGACGGGGGAGGFGGGAGGIGGPPGRSSENGTRGETGADNGGDGAGSAGSGGGGTGLGTRGANAYSYAWGGNGGGGNGGNGSAGGGGNASLDIGPSAGGGGGGGYGGGILTIKAGIILRDQLAQPAFLVSGQRGGFGGPGATTGGEYATAGCDGAPGEGGMLIIDCPHYVPAIEHWTLGADIWGAHTVPSANGGHGIVVGNPQAVFINARLATPLTSVRLEATPGSSSSQGVPVRLRVVANGLAPEYRIISRAPGAQSYAVIREWSAEPVCGTWAPIVGQHVVIAYAREIGTDRMLAAPAVYYTVKPPISSVALASSPASPTAVGTSISFLAGVTGGANVEYRYEARRSGDAQPSFVRDYILGRRNTIWVPSEPGTYTVTVTAREQGTTTTVSASKTYVVNPKVSALLLERTAPATVPVAVGVPLYFLSTATGGGTLEFQFLWNYSTTTKLSAIWTKETYGNGRGYTFKPTEPGYYTFRVYAREKGSTANFQVSSVDIKVQVKPAVSSYEVQFAPSSQGPVGGPITISAVNVVGGAQPQWKFWAKRRVSGATWVLVRDYAAGSTAEWRPDTAGTYDLMVYCREVGSKAPTYDKCVNATYVVK